MCLSDFVPMSTSPRRKSIQERLVEEPWVGIGAVLTGGVLVAGMESFRRGHATLSQQFMRARVFLQIGTVFAMAGGGLYASQMNKGKPITTYEERKNLSCAPISSGRSTLQVDELDSDERKK